MRLFQFCWWYATNRLEQTAVVKPFDPFQRKARKFYISGEPSQCTLGLSALLSASISLNLILPRHCRAVLALKKFGGRLADHRSRCD